MDESTEKNIEEKIEEYGPKIKRFGASLILVVFVFLFIKGWLNHDKLISDAKKGCVEGVASQLPTSLTPTQINNLCTCATDRLAEKVSPFDAAISKATFGIYNPVETKVEAFDFKYAFTLCKEVMYK